jgi:NADPH:quinone reductase-like Zn-dependent oxidoreductase
MVFSLDITYTQQVIHFFIRRGRNANVGGIAWLHRLPPNMSFEEGALVEPLAVALAGIERAKLALGDPVLICGAGPIGIVTLLAARRRIETGLRQEPCSRR